MSENDLNKILNNLKKEIDDLKYKYKYILNENKNLLIKVKKNNNKIEQLENIVDVLKIRK